MEILLNIGFSIAGFSILLQAQKSRQSIANKLAIAILALWFIRFLLLYLKSCSNLSGFPWLYFMDQSLFFLDGVLLFWFSISLTKKRFSYIKESLHLLPFILSIIPTIILFINLDKSQLFELYQQAQSNVAEHNYAISLEEVIFILAIITQNIIYLILTYKNIQKYDREILSQYSTVDKIRLEWFPKLLILWALLLVLPVALYFINYLNPIIGSDTLEIFLIAAMVLVAAYFGYNSTHQLYANVELNEKRSKVVSTPKKVNEEEFQELYLRLQAYMSDKKPYLDEDLSLSGLAEQLGVKPNKLSNILKSQAKVNFYTYINGFRIEQIKKELVSTKEQVIIIAYNNGFKSKSTFNKVFKDFTGVSPTAYRRNKTE